MEKTADVRREIEATREKMAATATEIESRIQGKVDAVKDKLDVADHVRSHPWPALIAAVVVGAAVAASGSDRKVAVAATRAVKSAPRVTKKAAKSTATGAAHLAGAAVAKLRGGDDDHDSSDDGFFARMRERFAAQARELGEHLGRAADDIVRTSGGSRAASDGSMPTNRYAADAELGFSKPYRPTSAD